MEIKACRLEEIKGGRDGPITLSVRDIHGLIDLKVKIYFNKEGSIGQSQREQGHEFGVLISVTRDADRQKFVFEIAIGLGYKKTHIHCQEKDIDLLRALDDLAKLRISQERRAFRDQDNT